MIRKIVRLIKSDTLYLNSLYLMANTIFMAGMGFIFWLINAHLFSSEQIGIATTLISAMTLVSYTSLLGFNSTFIRFLPTAKDRDTHMNTGLLLTVVMAIIIAMGYVALVPWIAPKLGVIHHLLYGFGFVILAALAAVNLLTDSIFIAFRAAKYNLLVDGMIMSTIKVLLPVFFVSLGAYGIFAASGAAAALAFVASIYFLKKNFNYRPALKVDKTLLRSVIHYSFSSYAANLLNIAPTLLLPLIIINKLGASSAAYFYLAFMISNLLYTVAYSVSQSLFAEGSYEDRTFRELVKKASAVLAVVTAVGSLAVVAAAPIVLKVFGETYAQNATTILRILAASAPAVALYVVANVLLRLKKMVYNIILINIIYLIVICGLALAWANRGLAWIGLAWLLGNALSGLTGVIFLMRSRSNAVEA